MVLEVEKRGTYVVVLALPPSSEYDRKKRGGLVRTMGKSPQNLKRPKGTLRSATRAQAGMRGTTAPKKVAAAPHESTYDTAAQSSSGEVVLKDRKLFLLSRVSASAGFSDSRRTGL